MYARWRGQVFDADQAIKGKVATHPSKSSEPRGVGEHDHLRGGTDKIADAPDLSKT